MINDALVKEVKRLEKELADTKEELEQLKVDYKDAEDEVKQHHEAGEKNTDTFNKLNDMYNKVLKENVELKVEVEFHEKEIKELEEREAKLEKEIVSSKKESQARLNSLSAQYKQIEDLKKEARTVISDTRAAISKDFKNSPTVKKLEDEKKDLQARLDKVVENNLTLKQENQAFRESRLKRKRKRLEKAEEKRKQVKTVV